ncbi:MAG: hypothetical protein RLZ33_2429 [Bacteroidota bacterium]|jgi:hypothetical protein
MIPQHTVLLSMPMFLCGYFYFTTEAQSSEHLIHSKKFEFPYNKIKII